MRATLVVVLVALGAGGACRRQAPAATIEAAAAPKAAADAVDAIPERPGGKIYSEAVARARKEITADNARERLVEIERQIELEAAGGS
ncbi:MAG: hypothetical protein HY903_03175 [Deltaproteobacteria bacterium]|nr:hypothetical protein [Deltaproteobacteria bacterium]